MDTRTFTALGCVYIYMTMTPDDVGLPRHQHDEDHLMFVVEGQVLVTTDDKELVRTPVDLPVLFKANRFHAIKPLTACRVVNVFREKVPITRS
jgi:mannose-6-phosphate isomerase-like protein (cupin superfamily)